MESVFPIYNKSVFLGTQESRRNRQLRIASWATNVECITFQRIPTRHGNRSGHTLHSPHGKTLNLLLLCQGGPSAFVTIKVALLQVLEKNRIQYNVSGVNYIQIPLTFQSAGNQLLSGSLR